MSRRNEDLDGVDPRSTFIRTDGPPFPSHPRVAAVSTNGREKKGRDQRDAKDVKRDHSGTKTQGTVVQVSLRRSALIMRRLMLQWFICADEHEQGLPMLGKTAVTAQDNGRIPTIKFFCRI